MTEQISQAVEAIKLAYLSHTPVVWLVTGDKEVASEIVEEFTCEHFGAFRSPKMPHAVFLKEFSDRSSDSAQTPSVFYLWHSVNCSKNESEKNEKVPSLMSSIEKFITCYANLNVEPNVQAMTDEHKDSIRLSVVIIASPARPPESWLVNYIEVVNIKPLRDEDIQEMILLTLRDKGITLQDKDRLSQMVVNLRGFSSRKITQTIGRCVLSGFFDINPIKWSKVFDEIRLMKRQMLEGFVGLKWIDLQVDNAPEDQKSEQSKAPASLDVLSQWFEDRAVIFKDTERARKLGYDIPKGVLITGIPGTGKSMMAKESAKKLRLPLIALDMGDLQEGIVGASEQHMEEALRMVEAMAPCVLWIDEIEKAFSGSNSGASDGGVMRRMFGKFLTWMQEKTEPCFVFATSNDISKLPPELFRSERFDDKFFSFLPMVDECAAIFSNMVNGENAKYTKNNPEEFGSLFSAELTNPDTWKEFLNQYSKKNGMISMDANKWKDGKIPQKKLFTGADISMLVKLVKFSLIKKYQGGTSNFKKALVLNMVEEVLEDFMPYGQTNLTDVADCFVLLSRNRFRSASSSCVFSFDDYDVEKSEMCFNVERYNQNADYDKVLYAAVVGAVNNYADKENMNRHENI